MKSLDQWLQWQMALHDKAIDLGLERVREVGEHLGIEKIAATVITIAGTNGKGSSVALYENWLHHAGYRVASYTSPHLLRYNERIRFDCIARDDAELCNAFAAVEAARRKISLTYFEFGTLAALFLIQQEQPEFAVLEVGLGGRLDAVNIVDADLAHLTPIGLDHQSYLGDTREQIGFEKAGVLRRGIPVVLNDSDPPQTVLGEIERLDCNCLQLERDYGYEQLPGGRLGWRGRGLEIEVDQALHGAHQAMNLAGVIAGLSCLFDLGGMEAQRLQRGFAGIRVPGRFERLPGPLNASLYIDVGHNPHAAAALARSLAPLRRAGGEIVVLLGMLQDKECARFVAELKPVVDRWWLLSLESDRGLRAVQLAERIAAEVTAEALFDEASTALEHALSSLGNQDIMLVTGSFVTVEMFLRALPVSGD